MNFFEIRIEKTYSCRSFTLIYTNYGIKNDDVSWVLHFIIFSSILVINEDNNNVKIRN